MLLTRNTHIAAEEAGSQAGFVAAGGFYADFNAQALFQLGQHGIGFRHRDGQAENVDLDGLGIAPADRHSSAAHSSRESKRFFMKRVLLF